MRVARTPRIVREPVARTTPTTPRVARTRRAPSGIRARFARKETDKGTYLTVIWVSAAEAACDGSRVGDIYYRPKGDGNWQWEQRGARV